MASIELTPALMESVEQEIKGQKVLWQGQKALIKGPIDSFKTLGVMVFTENGADSAREEAVRKSSITAEARAKFNLKICDIFVEGGKSIPENTHLVLFPKGRSLKDALAQADEFKTSDLRVLYQNELAKGVYSADVTENDFWLSEDDNILYLIHTEHLIDI